MKSVINRNSYYNFKIKSFAKISSHKFSPPFLTVVLETILIPNWSDGIAHSSDYKNVTATDISDLNPGGKRSVLTLTAFERFDVEGCVKVFGLTVYC